MKINKIQISLLLAGIFLLFGCGGSGNKDVKKAQEDYTPFLPTKVDVYEGNSSDNILASASSIIVDAPSQIRSIFPVTDVDYVKVVLHKGQTYEVSTNNLYAQADTNLTLLDENGTFLANNDNYISFDSRLKIDAAYSGVFYIVVSEYYRAKEITSYNLGVRKFVDKDNDGFSSYYDCDDTNSSINPDAPEKFGDGIDEVCKGVDLINYHKKDVFEPDDFADESHVLVQSPFNLQEDYAVSIYKEQQHSIDVSSDVDWLRVTLPAYGSIELDVEDYNNINIDLYYENNQTVLDSDMIYIDNLKPTAQTYLLKAHDDNQSDWYIAKYIDLGIDRDGDGYTTKDYFEQDCNDNNASINPGADDNDTSDGIDKNCDGIDGVYHPTPLF